MICSIAALSPATARCTTSRVISSTCSSLPTWDGDSSASVTALASAPLSEPPLEHAAPVGRSTALAADEAAKVPGLELGRSRGPKAEATAHTAVESQHGHLSSLKAARIAAVRSTLALRAAASRTRSSRSGSELRTESAWMASFASS